MSRNPEPVPELEGGRQVVGRVSASVVDQGLSTATNLFITLIAARALGVREFGTFGAVYLVATAIGGCVRSGLGGTLLIFQGDALRDGGAKPFGAAAATGLVSSAALVVAGVAIGGELRSPLLALALTLPGMLVQDTGRLLGFTALQPVRALVLDVVWAVAMGVGLVVAAALGPLTAGSLMLVWGASGTVSGLWALWQQGGAVPRPSIAWFRHTWEFAWRYLLVFAATMGVFQVTTLILGGISGVAAVGAVRATQVLFGPIQNLATGLMVAFLPATTTDTRLRDLRGRLLFMSAVLTGAAAVILAVALVLPDPVGEALLGDTWEEARRLLVPAGLGSIMFGVTSGAVVGLRAARAAHESLVISLQMCAFQFVIPVAGAVVGDEGGYMWALFFTWIIGTALWWRSYLAMERSGPRPETALA